LQLDFYLAYVNGPLLFTDERIKKIGYTHTYHGLSFSHKEKLNYVIFRKIDGTGDFHVERDNPSSKGQISQVLIHLWNLDIK
jgi:hypothetical protein